jgi:hypothetical protein
MNDKPTVQEYLTNPEKVLDDAYNKGIDDAIRVVNNNFIKTAYSIPIEKLLENIIFSLSKLKSNGDTDNV